MDVQGGMQEKRGSEVHVERARELQHGDDLQRGRRRRRESRVDKGIEKRQVVAHAPELGSQLAVLPRSPKPEPILQANPRRRPHLSLPQRRSFLLELRPDLFVPPSVLLIHIALTPAGSRT